jgi:hypothetical protein
LSERAAAHLRRVLGASPRRGVSQYGLLHFGQTVGSFVLFFGGHSWPHRSQRNPDIVMRPITDRMSIEVGDFKGHTGRYCVPGRSCPRGLRVDLNRDVMRRALLRRDAALVIDLRRGHIAMAEQFLDLADVLALLEKERRCGRAKNVGVVTAFASIHRLRKSREIVLKGAIHGGVGDGCF